MNQLADLFSIDENVPGEYAAALERACQCLVEAYQNAPMSSFQNLVDDLLLLSRPPKAAAGQKGAWLLKSSPNVEQVGQTLMYQNRAEQAQELLLSLDAKGNFYLGAWRSLKPGQENLGFMFHLQPSADGNHLILDDGQNKKQHVLGNLTGLAGWGSLAGFLEGMKALTQSEEIPPETIEQTPAPQAAPTPAAPASQPEPLPATEVGNAPALVLVVQPGDRAIPLEGSLSIGREPENDLCLPDTKLSRRHAVIESVGQGWQVRDLGSTNGTSVNGKRISAPLRIKIGDVIELGNSRLTLELR